MKNKLLHESERRGRFPRMLAVAVMAAATIASFAGCSPKADDKSGQRPCTASNVTLTAAQRQNIHLYTVAPSRFHKTVETTGAVDFDNDQATSVLAPFSGPVSRLLVSPRRAGQEGRAVGGGGFARLRRRHQRLSQGARHRQDHPPACRPGQGSARASRRRPARSGAGRNRRRQRRGRPRRRPASARLAECRSGRPSRTSRTRPADCARRRHDPLADRRHGGGKADHARRTSAGGHHAVLHRRRSFARLGHGADFRCRPRVGQRRRSGRSGDRHRRRNDFSGTVDNISALVDPDTRSVRCAWSSTIRAIF